MEISTDSQSPIIESSPGLIKGLQVEDFIPKTIRNNYSCESIEKRLDWLEDKNQIELNKLRSYSINPQELHGNIEQMIGVTQIPVGIAGPLLVNGDHAKGKFYLPMATTEGALVQSYTRGMLALTQSGGVTTKLLQDFLHITPVFVLDNISQAYEFKIWVENNFLEVKVEAEKITTHGKLLKLEPIIMGSMVYVKFIYSTGDAMGMNMINKATDFACQMIRQKNNIQEYYLRSNLSCDKKSSFNNYVNGYGKSLLVEAILPKRIVKKYFHVSPEQFKRYIDICYLGAFQAGTIGCNAQFANALAAIYIATGQDVAQVVNSCAGTTILNTNSDGDLVAQLQVPNLVLGTVGGGTSLPTQMEALKIMNCYGENKSKKFAEIVAASLLAGELSIIGALISGDFVKIHNDKNAISKIARNLKFEQVSR